MSITEGCLPHVAQPYGALAGGVHEQVALPRVKLGGRDDLRQLLHVGRLDVDNVEALVGDLHVPEVDAQVVGGEVRLRVRVDGDGVDVVRVGVGEDAARRGLHHQLHWLQHRNLWRGGGGRRKKPFIMWETPSRSSSLVADLMPEVCTAYIVHPSSEGREIKAMTPLHIFDISSPPSIVNATHGKKSFSYVATITSPPREELQAEKEKEEGREATQLNRFLPPSRGLHFFSPPFLGGVGVGSGRGICSKDSFNCLGRGKLLLLLLLLGTTTTITTSR